MNAQDRIKLVKQGYTIYRRDDTPQPRIKIMHSGAFNWVTLDKFETKAARDRKAAEYAELEKWIED